MSDGREIYGLQFNEDDGHFYYVGEGGNLSPIPDIMLFEAICSELIQMSMDDVRTFADELDRGDVPLEKFLELILENVDEDTDVERVDDWRAVGQGLYVVFGYSASKWHDLFVERTEDVARKYLIHFTTKAFNRPFARWAHDNDIFQDSLFLDDTFKFMKNKMSQNIPMAIDKIRDFRDNKVTWLRFLEEIRDILLDMNSELEDFVMRFVKRRYKHKFDEWRGG